MSLLLIWTQTNISNLLREGSQGMCQKGICFLSKVILLTVSDETSDLMSQGREFIRLVQIIINFENLRRHPRNFIVNLSKNEVCDELFPKR